MEEKKSIIKWAKEHKKELIIIGVTAVGAILVIKNWDSIKGVFKSTDTISNHVLKIESTINKVDFPKISNDILDNLTGNKMTAKDLGNKLWKSSQEINKKIVGSGLATKMPCGEYSLTETGRLLGEKTLKTTRAGYTFSNIEWDEKILDIIFSKKELMEIAKKQKTAQEILSKYIA